MRTWFEVAISDTVIFKKGHENDVRDILREGERSEGVRTHTALPLADQISQTLANLVQSQIDEDFVGPDWFSSITELDNLRVALYTGPRSGKIAAYRVAAALFNAQLIDDQRMGLRMKEKPATSLGIQRALQRQKIEK